MSSTVTRPPRTALEVFHMMPEGTLAEVINNQFFMSPAPSPFHQRVFGSLFTSMNVFVQQNDLGEVFAAPVDLYLTEETNIVQPDILFITKSNPLSINEKGLHGTPDLIVEILSPGNQQHDLIKKKDLYEKSGVKEYWVVDPATKKAIGFLIVNGGYQLLGEHTHDLKSFILKKSFSF